MAVHQHDNSQVPQHIPSLASVEASIYDFASAMEEQVAPNRGSIRESFRIRNSLRASQSFSMDDHDEQDDIADWFQMYNGKNLGRNLSTALLPLKYHEKQLF